jgi:signal transduction histidine kinase
MPPAERVACSDEQRNLRAEESLLVVLNLLVLTALIGIHLVLFLTTKTPVTLAISLFVARAAMQVFEWLWLHSAATVRTPETLTRYAVFAVWANVAFACLASLVSGVPHSHYIVLMVLPTIAAAFRRSWTMLAGVIAVAITVSFVYVGVIQQVGTWVERQDELFEAATDMLTLVAVATVVRAIAIGLRTEQSRLRATVAALHETRDRLVHEEKLGAVGRLSASIAHEIRNPVGMMSTAIATAQRPDCPPVRRDEMYAIVARESERLTQLTSDFLSFARQSEPQRRPTAIRTTLEYVAALVRPRAAESDITVLVECANDELASLDAAQIHQALLNLASNALDAVARGSTIRLGGRISPPDGATLYVSQPGPPIPADVQSRLFEPFFTTKPRGTGLGLAISRKIAQAHGGDLQLTQNGPDEVRFSLLIPSR